MLEVVVSVSILVIALVSTVQSNVSTRRLSTHAEETLRATQSLRAASVLLSSSTPDELIGVGGAFEPGVALDLPAVLEGQVVTYTLPDHTDGDPIPSLVGFRITTTWQSARRQERSMSLVGATR